MANNKLQSVIQIDGVDYEVVAATAEKVQGTLNITAFDEEGLAKDYIFDGSDTISIDVTRGGGGAGNADEIQVHMDNGEKRLATISIRSVDPESDEGKIGDIWFKYSDLN